MSTLVALAALVCAPAAHAVLQDEIQVYDDGINRPGEFGTEVHVNTTPSGRGTPDYPGERLSPHGLRVTPEFSWGLSRNWEAGLYVPIMRDATGTTSIPGLKLRMKWMGLRSDDNAPGWFGGVNLEISRVRHAYEEATISSELKFIGGRRWNQWLVAGNLNLDKAFAGPDSATRPAQELALKVTRAVVPGWAPGIEYYHESGPLGRPAPRHAQDRRLFLITDIDAGRFPVSLGVGRGLTPGADRWTVKAILDLPFS